MFRKLLIAAAVVIGAIPLASCTRPSAPDRATATAAADAAGLAPRTLAAGGFVLHARLRVAPEPAAVLAVFLEGDGFAWIDRATPSPDPTPRRPVALALAARSGLPSVAYLARPCQWVTGADRRGCRPRWWTTHRLAAETVDAAGAAIDALKAEAGARTILLIGHSGGGGLAALLAARRADVAGLVTVAGVTDLGAWTTMHAVSALPESLDPAAARAGWGGLPQVHLLGAADTVVPAGAAAAWAAPTVVVPGVGHLDGWAADWPALERLALDRLDLSPPLSAGRS